MSPSLNISRWLERLPGPVYRRLGRLVGSDFAQKVAETFATRIGLILIGLTTSIIIARSLGPEARGIQAAIGAITAVGVQFGNLGLHSSNTYHVAKEPKLLGSLVGNSLLVSLGFGSVLVLLVGVALTLFPQIAAVKGIYLALALAGIPLGLCLLLLQNLLIGTHRVREYNAIELVGKIAGVAALALIVVTGMVSVGTVVLAGLVVSAAACAWTGYILVRGRSLKMKPSLSMLRAQMAYGFKAYVAALFAYTVLKADMLMCAYMLGAEQTGQYSIAVSIADLVYMLPVVAGTIAFPRLAATEDPAERWGKAKSMAKWIAVVMLVFAVVAAILARPAVNLLYGAAYLPSVPAFLWLLPGIVLLGVNTILMNYFAAEGMPPIAIWSPALASAVNLALNFILLPRIGIAGASIASSVAYALMLVASIAYVRASRRRWR